HPNRIVLHSSSEMVVSRTLDNSGRSNSLVVASSYRLRWQARAPEAMISVSVKVLFGGLNMLFGVGMFATDYAIPPQELAREAESRGFESIWFPEHTHIPVSRRTPYPGGGDLPEEYWHTHDLFVALTAAAVVTTKIKIASGICLVIERDPIITA